MTHACQTDCQVDCALKDAMLLHDIRFTQSQLEKSVQDAETFHARFMEECIVEDGKGLINPVKQDWAKSLLRKNTVPQAVIEKISSWSFMKRRPENQAPFLSYVDTRFAAQEPLLFRVGFGPLKNVRCCGSEQNPDLAEYLTFIQLSRVMHSISALYPYGIKVQIIPDNLRTLNANRCTECYMHCYISGLQKMVKLLSFDAWMRVEYGQADLFEQYNVSNFTEAAEQKIKDWQTNDPVSFQTKWESAVENAGKNINPELETNNFEAIQQAAWRYLVAHQSEVLSGMWAPRDAFPLRYGNHPQSYQLYSLGNKYTKLPWQISLSQNLLAEIPAQLQF